MSKIIGKIWPRCNCCDFYCRFFWRYPEYKPEKWNDADGIQYKNNCYNYACNKITNTYAQPGRAAGNMYSALNCTAVTKGAISDNLKTTQSDITCEHCYHKVALVIWLGWDYHWYRQDKNGKWSHKPGGTQATNLDNSGNLITDPQTADRGLYIEFCGYFCACICRIKIR